MISGQNQHLFFCRKGLKTKTTKTVLRASNPASLKNRFLFYVYFQCISSAAPPPKYNPREKALRLKYTENSQKNNSSSTPSSYTKVLAVIMILFFLFFGCVREEKPGRVMSCVWYFAGSEAHWQNTKHMTSMATAIFSYTAGYFCFCSFPFPYHFRRKALILYSVGATHY